VDEMHGCFLGFCGRQVTVFLDIKALEVQFEEDVGVVFEGRQ
jgi:hypothetical protein